MLALLSPAKNLRESVPYAGELGVPMFKAESGILSAELAELGEADIRALMGVSSALAQLNAARFRVMRAGDASVFPALLLFHGDVYRAMAPETFDERERAAAASSLRILSGLYGLLRPYDGVAPYRLEMGTKFACAGARDLYEFWGRRLAEAVNREVEEAGAEFVVNLASDEYAAAVFGPHGAGALRCKAVHMRFKERGADGRLRVVGVNAKRVRGAAAAFMVRTNPRRPEDLRDFFASGYRFSAEEPDGGLLFVKERE